VCSIFKGPHAHSSRIQDPLKSADPFDTVSFLSPPSPYCPAAFFLIPINGSLALLHGSKCSARSQDSRESLGDLASQYSFAALRRLTAIFKSFSKALLFYLMLKRSGFKYATVKNYATQLFNVSTPLTIVHTPQHRLSYCLRFFLSYAHSTLQAQQIQIYSKPLLIDNERRGAGYSRRSSQRSRQWRRKDH
jgi:hypothetical protein